MSRRGTLLPLIALWAVAMVCMVGVVVGLGWGGVIVCLVVGPFYCWMLYALVYYRVCRREELLFVLAGAVEDGVPVGAAVRAYLHDRPAGHLREFWLATLLTFVVPGYYWIWYRRSNFDRRVAELARQLELGLPLWRALEAMPALASREAVLAAAVGESSGELARCLRGVAGRHLRTRWLELVPKLAYPGVLLLIVLLAVVFLGMHVMPKYEQILAGFGSSMPPLTERLLPSGEELRSLAVRAAAVLPLGMILLAGVLLSSHARWFFPFFGRIYRRTQSSRILQALALLLEVGKPIPESLRILAGLPLPSVARRRILRACEWVEHGEPFVASLERAGLLSAAMVPLVRAAERAGNLPWALAELADSLYNRTSRMLERIAQALFPLGVILVGGVVGIVVVAVFIPMIQVLVELAR